MTVMELIEQNKTMNGFFQSCEFSNMDRCTVKRYKKRQSLVRRGENAANLILIVTGKLNVYNEFANGRNYIFENIGKGALIGEMEILAGNGSYTSTVEAMTDSTAILFNKEQYLEWFNQYEAFSRNAARRVAAMLCDISVSRGENIVHTGDYTVALQLLRLYDEATEENGTRIITETRNIISEQTGVSPRTVNRAICRFNQKNMIYLVKGKININKNNYDKLTNFLGRA